MQSVIPERALEQFQTVTRLLHDGYIRSEAHAKAVHERFNIFSTLLSDTDEVRLHTRFLQCLLDPKGLHDCDSLFLNLFFATLNEIPGLDHNDNPVRILVPNSEAEWTVRKEQCRPPHGQIDLLLECTGLGIAIENKINAAEQTRQLAAYADYLKQRHGISWKLIYLTKDGKQSRTHENNPYIRISYRDHILPWLEKCLRETYHIIPVNQSLQQYRQVVRNFTGKTLDAIAMKPITNFILQNPSILQYRRQIMDAATEARATFLDQLADGIAIELRKRGFTTQLRLDLQAGRFGLDEYGDLFITPPNHELLNAPFVFCFENDSELEWLLIGLTKRPGQDRLTAPDKSLLKQMDALLTADAEARGYHKDKPNEGWPTGWHNIIQADDESLATLIRIPLQDTVSKICIEILGHVDLIERVYLDAKRIK